MHYHLVTTAYDNATLLTPSLKRLVTFIGRTRKSASAYALRNKQIYATAAISIPFLTVIRVYRHNRHQHAPSKQTNLRDCRHQHSPRKHSYAFIGTVGISNLNPRFPT
jgi:hypothetical protein